jgi:hypothetical protein
VPTPVKVNGNSKIWKRMSKDECANFRARKVYEKEQQALQAAAEEKAAAELKQVNISVACYETEVSPLSLQRLHSIQRYQDLGLQITLNFLVSESDQSISRAQG